MESNLRFLRVLVFAQLCIKYITLCAIVLILLQFVYSLTLYEDELPITMDGRIDLKTLGLRTSSDRTILTLRDTYTDKAQVFNISGTRYF